MDVRILLFAQMRIRAGTGSVGLTLPEGATVADALEVLLASHPELRAHAPSCMMAVGLEYADASHRLRPGDELSLIPPVQGG